MKTEQKTLQSIQLLRGVACMLVVLFHAGGLFARSGTAFLGNFFAFGGSGVDIFFTLSGFIIAYTGLKTTGRTSNITAFLRKRFIRIYPIYWFVITGLLLLQIVLPQFGQSGYSLSPSNILSTYLLLPGHQMLNGVSWSLTNELFFYLLFCTAFFIKNRQVLFALTVAYLVFLLVYAVAIPGSSTGGPWHELLTTPMNIEFFLGVLVAVFFQRIPSPASRPLLISGILLFIAAGVASNDGMRLSDGALTRVFCFGLPSVLIIAGLARMESHQPIKVNRVFRELGDASYSLYLIHLPLLAAAMRFISVAGDNPVVRHIYVLVLIAAISLLSIFVYRLVERPLIRSVHRK
ncbi:MAG: acyltransferase, partial [Chitinophagaceae bacterium]